MSKKFTPIKLIELFELDEIQKIQDEFSDAMNVASIITDTNGVPITKPSNFTDLCMGIIRKTEVGCLNCYDSDKELGAFNPDGATVKVCKSGGLWDAGAAITVDGVHIASWLIGQVRDKTQTEENAIKYAKKIGANEELYLKAFNNVPKMSEKQFKKIAKLLYTLANQLSTLAYQNLQQKKIIEEKNIIEKQLLAVKEQYELAINGTNEGIWDWNLKTNEVFFSKRWKEILGYKDNELENRLNTFYSLIFENDLNRVLNFVKDYLNGEIDSYSIEFRMVHKNGSLRWIQAKGEAIRDQFGKPYRMAGSHSDITETKLAETSLKESEERLNKILKVVPDLISVQDKDYNIIYSNWNGKGDVKIKQQIVGGKCYTCYRGLNSVCSDCQAKKIFITKKAFENEIETIDGDWVELRVIPIFDKTGEIEFFVEWVRDITERKQAEKEQQRLSQQLQQSQKMDSIGRLAGGVAHDFNNMLGAIIGFTELSMKLAEGNELLLANLQEISSAANRSAELTKQLLAFARKQGVNPKSFDLNSAISNMYNMLCRLIGENIELIWNPKTKVIIVEMDPTHIDQIIANLIINSKDAISEKGVISIETEVVSLDDSSDIGYKNYKSGEYVKLSVSDNGKGMDKETLSRVFEPFFTTKEIGKGTGLGLATIYGIVKQNSGFIDIKSELNRGTIFSIYLPFYTKSSNIFSDFEEKVVTKNGNETILLVEDEPSILKLTTMMLKHSGYNVLSSSNPIEALSIANSNSNSNNKKIDLLITDVIMPDMNGYELSKKILEIYPNIKILFMSGYTANVISIKNFYDGEINFIQKPFSIEEMKLKVRESLDSK
ncbi:PocR ligand-binding domain-containing protein [bacterium]|nr:PocR ligand-binding domain-containing protein [bacterium]